jgi:hypothetical protein
MLCENEMRVRTLIGLAEDFVAKLEGYLDELDCSNLRDRVDVAIGGIFTTGTITDALRDNLLSQARAVDRQQAKAK